MKSRAVRHFRYLWKRRIRHALPAVLAIPPFRRIFVGQAVSQFGDAMYYIVFLYMIERLAQSTQVTGVAGALMQIPFFLFGVSAGLVVDRFDRRLIMLYSDLISVVIMVALLAVAVFDPTPSAWLLVGVGFLLSAISAYFDPARTAAIPSLVPSEHYVEANGLATSMRTLMQLLGPLGTTILIPIIETAGPRWFFPVAIVVNLVTFGFSAYMIRKLPPLVPRAEHSSDRVSTGEKPPALREFGEGLKFVWGIGPLRIGLVFTCFLTLVVAPILLGYLAANRLWFGNGARTLAGMQAAFFLGMLVSSLIVIKIKVRHPGKAYALGMIGVGAAVSGLMFAQNYWMFFGLNMVAGFAFPFAVIPLSSYLQLVVPDDLRGRVNSTMNMLTNLFLPIGWISAGAIIDRFGPGRLFLGVGLAIFGSGLIGLALKTFREATMPETTPKPEPST